MSIEDDLVRDEGFKLFPYKDTVGKSTIGVGRNLDDVGITATEAMYLLRNDIAKCVKQLENHEFYKKCNETRKNVLINMCFNLGITGLMNFKLMIKAILDEDWERASEQMLDSKWAKQVGQRAIRLADKMRLGI